MLAPLKGFSEFDEERRDLLRLRSRLCFVKELKRRVKSKVRVVEFDAHINDPSFAKEAVRLLEELIESLGLR